MLNEPASAWHRPSVAYIPGGDHMLRCFGDRLGKPWCCRQTHQFQLYRAHCPDFFREIDPAGTYPPCALCQLATQPAHWRLRREAQVLIYGSLFATSHPSPYWRPGKTYLIIAPDRLRESLLQLLKQGNAQLREYFFAMINPTRSGPLMVVQVKKGRYGSVTIASFTDTYQPPVILGDWYKPFHQAWRGATFNLADYEALLAQVTRHNRTATGHGHTRTEEEEPDKRDNHGE